MPAVFARLDSGAPRTFGLYFMYDVKQADPSEWSSPPFEANIVDKPGFGKVVMGRGAVNQKGPEAAFLAALHAIHGAGRKLPINLVLVAEGEEEIGSPHIRQVTQHPEVAAALRKTVGVVMPAAWQDPDGNVTVYLGAKGVVECELIATGERWGRGPGIDVHSSNRARLDSPAFHLVQALAPREAWLRRHRSEAERRLRPDGHAARGLAHPVGDRGPSQVRDRASRDAADRRQLSGLCVHERAVASPGGALRPRAR